MRVLLGAKSDLASEKILHEFRDLGGIAVSSVNGDGINELLSWLEEAIAARFASGTSPVITRERHCAALIECVSVLECLDRDLVDVSPEVAAEQLRSGVAAIGRIVGSSGVEEILDVIFRDFCIGKRRCFT